MPRTRALATVLAACAVLAASACGHSYEKEDRRLVQVADSIHAFDGKVVHRDFRGGGGIDTTETLVLVVLRPGTLEDVVRDLVGTAARAGYEGPDPTGCVDASGRCHLALTGPASLPPLSLTAVPGGTSLFYDDHGTTRVVVVPEDRTGLLLAFSYRAAMDRG